MYDQPFAGALPESTSGTVRAGRRTIGDPLATGEFRRNGVPVWAGIGRPVPVGERTGWRCRVRVERGSRLEQSQVVAPTEREVLRMALELVSARLGMTEAQFLDGALIRSNASGYLLAAAR
ncbi:Uncharacterised protein [Nocardia farcinica]|uniref:Uncharacterized protein n=1 Tax=Nocardia farcinica TaxID=37329 RepID=A0A449GZR5_NOCFR|nr:hypothetical protein [Nocardia farcinica]VFA91304.1 Uncharacterised protein [Nocardia farcinica]